MESGLRLGTKMATSVKTDGLDAEEYSSAAGWGVCDWQQKLASSPPKVRHPMQYNALLITSL